MKHNLTTPDTGEIETLIAEAFDALHGPDPVRLQALRDGLDHAKTTIASRKSSNKLPWWTVLLVTGGLAAAAGWYVSDYANAPTREKFRPAASWDKQSDSAGSNEHLQRSHEARQPESPVIYQRDGR